MLEATSDNAFLRAQQIREGIRQLKIPTRGPKLEPTTISIGLACTSQGPSDMAALMKAAALYRAKHEGRDRVVVSDQAAAPIPEAHVVKTASGIASRRRKARPLRAHSGASKLNSGADTSPAAPPIRS
jgi:Diguanylate cyclase, GGDEF domain